MFRRDSYGERTWASLAGTALFGASAIGFSYLVHRYGFGGALRFIWEGDPHPESIREQLSSLRTAEKDIKRHVKIVATLEEGLQRARLDTIDDSDASAILDLWKQNLPKNLQDLRTRLALLSTDLDKVASRLDQVLPPQIGGEEVGQRKKSLSKSVVTLMERADALIDFFKTTTRPP